MMVVRTLLRYNFSVVLAVVVGSMWLTAGCGKNDGPEPPGAKESAKGVEDDQGNFTPPVVETPGATTETPKDKHP